MLNREIFLDPAHPENALPTLVAGVNYHASVILRHAPKETSSIVMMFRFFGEPEAVELNAVKIDGTDDSWRVDIPDGFLKTLGRSFYEVTVTVGDIYWASKGIIEVREATKDAQEWQLIVLRVDGIAPSGDGNVPLDSTSTIRALKERVDGFAQGTDIEALRAEVEGKADKAETEAEIARLNAELVQKAAAQAVAEQVASLQTDLQGKADTTAVEALESAIDGKAAQATVEALVQEVGGKAGTDALNAVERTVEGLEGAVAQKADRSELAELQTTVAGKVGANELAAVRALAQDAKDDAARKADGAQVDALDNRVSAAETALTGKATAGEVTALSGRMTTAEGAIATKASAESVGVLSGGLSEAQTDIAAAQDDIEDAKADIADLARAVEALQGVTTGRIEFRKVGSLAELMGMTQAERELGVVYLVPSEDATEGNTKDEYIVYTDDLGVKQFEQIGTTEANLEGYATIEQLDALRETVGAKADKTTVEGLTGRVGAVEGLLEGKADASRMIAVETRVGDVEARLGEKASQAELDALEETVADKATKAEVNALREEVEDVAGATDLAELSAQVAGKADKTTVNDLGARVASVEAQVEQKASEAIVTRLQATVDGKANQGDLDELEAALVGKADRETVETLTARVDGLASEDAIEALQRQVDLKASKESVDALGQRLTESEASINELDSKVEGKLDRPSTEGTSGQFLVSKGDGTSEWKTTSPATDFGAVHYWQDDEHTDAEKQVARINIGAVSTSELTTHVQDSDLHLGEGDHDRINGAIQQVASLPVDPGAVKVVYLDGEGFYKSKDRGKDYVRFRIEVSGGYDIGIKNAEGEFTDFTSPNGSSILCFSDADHMIITGTSASGIKRFYKVYHDFECTQRFVVDGYQVIYEIDEQVFYQDGLGPLPSEGYAVSEFEEYPRWKWEKLPARATTYDTDMVYNSGDLVLIDGKLFFCLTAGATGSPFNQSDWSAVGDDEALNDHINDKGNPHEVTLEKASSGILMIEGSGSLHAFAKFFPEGVNSAGDVRADSSNVIADKDVYEGGSAESNKLSNKYAAKSALVAHTDRMDNPHVVTLEQVSWSKIKDENGQISIDDNLYVSRSLSSDVLSVATDIYVNGSVYEDCSGQGIKLSDKYAAKSHEHSATEITVEDGSYGTVEAKLNEAYGQATTAHTRIDSDIVPAIEANIEALQFRASIADMGNGKWRITDNLKDTRTETVLFG